jgi:hypothetical protein
VKPFESYAPLDRQPTNRRKETAKMKKHDSTRRPPGPGPRILCVATGVVLLAALLLGVPAARAQSLDFGDGKHGVFPPVPEGGMPSSYNALVWNVQTGTVRYCNAYTPGTGLDACDGAQLAVAQIPNIPPGGVTTGVYEFTEFNLVAVYPQHRYLYLVGTSPNVPLSTLSTGNITLASDPNGYVAQFNVRGANGASALGTAPNLSVAGGRGGPGGFDGGASGNGGATPGHGNAGLGPAGAAGGRSGATTVAGYHGGPAGAAALNPSLTPLSGGSGGGGGAGSAPNTEVGCGANPVGYAGGGGGGGGGALLLAAAGNVSISGAYASIQAQGGNGGSPAGTGCGWGGGGAGGSVRIVAGGTFSGNGSIFLGGGYWPNNTNRAAGGYLRVEASANTFTGAIDGAAGGSFINFPTAPLPGSLPTLRITSINGSAAPASPGASMTAPDISFSQPIEAPVTLNVSASNVPLGTTVNIRVVPAVGEPTTATTTGLAGTVADSTASATVTLPPGAGVVTASAAFNVTSGGGGGGMALNALPLIDGQRPEKVEVIAMADGTSRTYLLAASGARFEIGRGTN